MTGAVRFRLASRALALGAGLAACGCIAKSGLISQIFAIDPPSHIERSARASEILSLRPVYVAAVYADTSLVYRMGEHRIERDPYAYWAASPGQMLTAATLGYLRNAPFVRDVVVVGEGVRVDAALEPTVTELCGDFSNPSEPAAVLTMQFRVLAPASGVTREREILLRTYRERVPAQHTAESVVAALNRALGEIMKRFLADLQAALPPRP